MRKYSIFLLIACLSIAFSSCTKDFENINKDPNRLDKVAPGTLIAPAQYYGHWSLNLYTFRINNDLMQYTVGTGSLNDYTRYVFRENEFNGIWSNLYKRANDMHKMYQLAEDINDVNNMAAALVMKTWLVSNLTDMFGDIPYTEAFKGDSALLFPKFDTQESVYTKLVENLELANSLWDSAKPMAGNDLFYNNDVVKWRKFTNSLALRLLMRTSLQSSFDAATKINAIVTNPTKYPIIDSNEDEALIKFNGVAPFINGFTNYRDAEFGGNRRMGAQFMQMMNNTADGRRARYATRNTQNAYIGIESGFSEIETIDMAHNNGLGTSTIAAHLKAADAVYPILTAAEVQFILAEAAYNGDISGNAEDYYNKAIEFSWKQWGATWDGGAGTTFLNDAGVKYNGTLERIINQKYIAMFFCGFEGWYDYRRTGFPDLTIGPAVENDRILPTRFEYPLIVRSTNLKNWEEARDRMGSDNFKTKVWWQNN